LLMSCNGGYAGLLSTIKTLIQDNRNTHWHCYNNHHSQCKYLPLNKKVTCLDWNICDHYAQAEESSGMMTSSTFNLYQMYSLKIVFMWHNQKSMCHLLLLGYRDFLITNHSQFWSLKKTNHVSKYFWKKALTVFGPRLCNNNNYSEIL